MLTKGKFLTIIKSIIIAVALIGLSLPVFEMTGDIVLPLIICVTGSFLICLCSAFLHFSERIIGNSLVILMLFWLLFAFIKEIILQIEYGWVFEWIEFFYFDKLLMLGSIWLSVSMFYCIKRLLCNESNDIEYSVFFKKASTAFLIFYIFLLVLSLPVRNLCRCANNNGEVIVPWDYQPVILLFLCGDNQAERRCTLDYRVQGCRNI